MKYFEEKRFILAIMKEACDRFISQKPSFSKDKSTFDLVTNIDLEIETFLTDKIKANYKQDTILSEEFNYDQKIKGRTWTIDPIDGTSNYSQSLPLYGIQCALIEHDEIVMSAIILPKFNETYYAIKGQGAYLNDQRITVSEDQTIEKTLVSFGDYQHEKATQAALQHAVIKTLYSRVARIRMFGAACVDFSFVGSGKTGATVVLTNNLWDIAPGLLICSEAGAVVSNVYGQPYTFKDFGVVAAANQKISRLITKVFIANKL